MAEQTKTVWSRKSQHYKIKNNFENISFYAETLDKEVLKSVTITMNGWFECENYRKLSSL